MLKKLYWVLFLYGTIFNGYAANHINTHETFSQKVYLSILQMNQPLL
jgi:hypothetical protein